MKLRKIMCALLVVMFVFTLAAPSFAASKDVQTMTLEYDTQDGGDGYTKGVATKTTDGKKLTLTVTGSGLNQLKGIKNYTSGTVTLKGQSKSVKYTGKGKNGAITATTSSTANTTWIQCFHALYFTKTDDAHATVQSDKAIKASATATSVKIVVPGDATAQIGDSSMHEGAEHDLTIAITGLKGLDTSKIPARLDTLDTEEVAHVISAIIGASNKQNITISMKYTWTKAVLAREKKSVNATKITPIKKKAGKGKVKIAWGKKGHAVTKYQIYRSTKKTSGFKKVATTTAKKKVLKAKKGKVYYYKVRGYFKMPHSHSNSKTYYTKWSKVIAIKAK